MPRKPAPRIVQHEDTAAPGASGASARDGAAIVALGLMFLLGVLISQPALVTGRLGVEAKD